MEPWETIAGVCQPTIRQAQQSWLPRISVLNYLKQPRLFPMAPGRPHTFQPLRLTRKLSGNRQLQTFYEVSQMQSTPKCKHKHHSCYQMKEWKWRLHFMDAGLCSIFASPVILMPCSCLTLHSTFPLHWDAIAGRSGREDISI